MRLIWLIPATIYLSFLLLSLTQAQFPSLMEGGVRGGLEGFTTAPTAPLPPSFIRRGNSEDQFREIVSQDSPELQKLGNQIKLTKTYQSDFVQERHLALFKEVLQTHGRFYFQLPGRLRWETTAPYVSLLISNEGHVARFLVENGKLKKMDLGMEDMFQQIVEEMTGIMRGDFQVLFPRYRMLLSPSGDQLVLQPRSESLKKSIASLEFTIEPQSGKVAQVVIREPGSDFTEIRFLNDRENIAFDESLFSLTSPLLPQ
jgi:outer membrane lipoprotein-sorting protein